MGLFSWIRRTKKVQASEPREIQSYDALPQASPDHNVNSLVHMYVEEIKSALEKAADESFVIGFKKPSEMVRRNPNGAPCHYRPEQGYLLYYLARPDADHWNGPAVENDGDRKATWILCANPHGLWLAVELFETVMEDRLVEIMRDVAVGGGYSAVLTTHKILRNGYVKGSVHWMKHSIHPTSIRTYRFTHSNRA